MTSKNYFETVAPAWDTMRKGFFSENVRRKALQVAEVKPGALSADLGAGTGFITEALLDHGINVIAVDESPAMLQELGKKYATNQGLQCKVGDAENLPIENDSLDYAFANMYLHHVERPAVAIQHAVEKLKKGGALVITDLDAHSHEYLKTEHNDRWMGFERKDITKWYEAAGLERVTVDCVGETCNSTSSCGGGEASISIFYAIGYKK